MSGYTDRITQVPDSYKTITFLEKPFSLAMLAETVRRVFTGDRTMSAIPR
jgi:hypothetical protein